MTREFNLKGNVICEFMNWYILKYTRPVKFLLSFRVNVKFSLKARTQENLKFRLEVMCETGLRPFPFLTIQSHCHRKHVLV